MKFPSTTSSNLQRYLHPLFQNQWPLFHKYLNPQVRINKMVNEHIVDYHPITWGLTAKIHSLIFLWSPSGFIFLTKFVEFFLKSVYPDLRVCISCIFSYGDNWIKFHIYGVPGKCILSENGFLLIPLGETFFTIIHL